MTCCPELLKCHRIFWYIIGCPDSEIHIFFVVDSPSCCWFVTPQTDGDPALSSRPPGRPRKPLRLTKVAASGPLAMSEYLQKDLSICGFPKMGLPATRKSSIFFHGIFHEINHPAIGVPPFVASWRFKSQVSGLRMRDEVAPRAPIPKFPTRSSSPTNWWVHDTNPRIPLAWLVNSPILRCVGGHRIYISHLLWPMAKLQIHSGARFWHHGIAIWLAQPLNYIGE